MPLALVAAERAEGASAYDEMAETLRIALALLPVNDPRQPRLCARFGLALAWAFCFDEALKVAGEAVQPLAMAEGDDAAAEYLAAMLMPMWEGGFFPGAFTLAKQGLAYAGTRRDATWMALKAMDIIRQETEAFGSTERARVAPDAHEREELSRIWEQLIYEQILSGSEGWQDVQWYSDENVLNHLSREALRASVGYFRLGEWRTGANHERQRAANAEERGRLAKGSESWTTAFRYHTMLGQFDLAREARERSMALAARLPNPSMLSGILHAGEDEWRMALDQDWDAPVEHLGHGLGQGTLRAWLRVDVDSVIARRHARMGRADRALRRLNAVLTEIDSARVPVKIMCDAAETLWLIQKTSGIDVIERKLRENVDFPAFHHPMVDGRLALARLCALQGRYDEAVEWFAKAHTVLDEQGARPLRAIVDYDEALMYARRGDPGDRERAVPLLEAALGQFRAIGMPGWIRDRKSTRLNSSH